MNITYISHPEQVSTHQLEKTVEKCPNQTINPISSEITYHLDNL